MSSFDNKDYYFQKAKAQGFSARSVFKLEEIDQKLKLIKPNTIALDLGCAPGSWLEYLDKKLKASGCALGVDLKKVEAKFKNNIKCIQEDVFSLNKQKISDIMLDLKENFADFDVILSDMAPKTSGIKHLDQIKSYDLVCKVFEVGDELLKPGGSIVVKVFDSQEINVLIKTLKTKFRQVKHLRPKSIRKQSKEFYLACIGFYQHH